MRTFCKFNVALAILFFTASAAAERWSIPRLDVDITVNADSSITVRETIVADFTREAHHGIYRHIPVRYRNPVGLWFNARIHVVSITDDKNKPWWYKRSRQGDCLFLKIGDRKRTFRDKRVFVITYVVERGVGFFDDHDELYWNAVGDQWPVTIKSAKCTVHLPKGVAREDIDYRAFTGPFRSLNRECSSEIKPDGTIVFTSTKPLRSGEGMTVLVGWPKGVVEKPGLAQKTWWLLSDNWPLFVPIIAAVVLLLLWLKYGRDPRGRGTVMVQYEPPAGVTALEAGTIIDEKLDARDITANIVQLAINGYMQIRQDGSSPDDIVFEKGRDFEGDTSLKSHEKIILRKIFEKGDSTTLASLKNEFGKAVMDLKKKVYKNLVKSGYFAHNPASVRAGFFVPAFIIALVGFFVGATTESFLHMLAFFVTGAMVFLVGRFMPRKTRKGVLVVEHLRGLEEFIRRAEKDSIQESERRMMFEKLLPYAMMLGIDSELVEKFGDVYRENPAWFAGAPGAAFSPVLFAASMRSTNQSMLSTVSSVTRTTSFGSGTSGFSSGGGFSGGGGGGGGGGGW